MFTFPDIPDNSILGINYSGIHDSSIAIVSSTGKPLFALSLERISRVKQDGRPLYTLLKSMPWESISKVAISTDEEFIAPSNSVSKTHPVKLPEVRNKPLIHEKEFYRFIDQIPCGKEFVCHHLSHASSAFWGSGLCEAICFTYDGGVPNNPWFGGLYQARRKEGIFPLDCFSAMHYAKITTLYTVVTALLGFTPNKHEGKITGLAAFGTPSGRCGEILKHWFKEDYFELESTLRWIFAYEEDVSAQLVPNLLYFDRFTKEISGIPREEIAATLQEMAECHILEILSNARSLGWESKNICLSGGLFANVKLNQRVSEAGFDQLFVAPPMTDDGTALGAAWHIISRKEDFCPGPLTSMYLGPSYNQDDVFFSLKQLGVTFDCPNDPAIQISKLLSKGFVVAVFQGPSEFGPRALGNRTILAQATKSDINQTLNDRLRRTEFMPFAPITRLEDASFCYDEIGRVQHAAEFMTVTVNCTDEMKHFCPAVVHVDGTARPQLVTNEINSLIYQILTHYYRLTEKRALVNTSFNIHEEPIVCTPEDALRGFFTSGLDYLYFEPCGVLVQFTGNEAVAVKVLQERINQPSQKNIVTTKHLMLLNREQMRLQSELEEKEEVITSLAGVCNERDRMINNTNVASSSERELSDLKCAYNAHVQTLKVQLKDKNQQMNNFLKQLNDKDKERTALQCTYNAHVQVLKIQLKDKDQRIDNFLKQLKDKDDHRMSLQLICDTRLQVIDEQKAALEAFMYARVVHKIRSMIRHYTKRIRIVATPKLGVLCQHHPKLLQLPKHYYSQIKCSRWPKISIVTPSFQQGSFIERTIKSVLDQKYPDLEYIVQDGASNDETIQVLQKYEDKLTGWKSMPDKGQSEAINLGMRQTTGEIMAWLNSDDILLPGSIPYVAKYFEEHPNVDVVYGHRILIDDYDQEIGRWILPAHDNAVLSWADYVPQETLFWRRHIWEKVGSQIDESFRFAMDWDLILRFRDAGARFVRIPRFLGAFRIHEAQKTSAVMHKIGLLEMDRLRERCHGKYVDTNRVSENIRPYMRKHILSHCSCKFLEKVRRYW